MPSYAGPVGEDILTGLRLDRYVSERLQLLSRSQIKPRALKAKLNGKEVKISRLLKKGEFLELSWADPEPSELLPQDLPLDIIYEDGQVVVVNKAQGMVVHPGAGNRRDTLANALLFRRLSRGGAGEGFRPGIVHRLDKDTSGVIIAAYDDEALAFLAEEFKTRRVKKYYQAIVKGSLQEGTGSVETRIIRDSRDRKRFAVSPDRGKTALTYYRVVRSWGSHSLLLLRPKTGRTHQLRVHMRYLGHPILGDPLYGGPDPLFPQATLMLHAQSLSLRLPGRAEPDTFKTGLPERFFSIFHTLEGK
jgi:23S rRNA pseudouridine1911/1915/1917 synthase